jgi:antirestriction protein
MSIETDSRVSISDLSTRAEEAADILADDPDQYEPEDIEEAKADLKILADFVANCNHSFDPEDPYSIVAALDSIGQDEDTLISEDTFEDYAQELVEDLGMIPEGLSDLIKTNIDWDGVAKDLRSDYSSVTLDGVDYLHR